MKAMLESLRALLRHERISHSLHKGHGWAHMAYLGAVSAEAHGWYGRCAAVLLVLSIILAFSGQSVEE